MRIARRDFLAGSAAAAALVAMPWRAGAAEPGPSGALDDFFAAYDKAFVERRPQLETQLGLRYDRGDWDDPTDAFARAEHEREQQAAAQLASGFDPAALEGRDRLSRRLFLHRAERNAAAFPWRLHNYTVSHLYGQHTGVPAFLINQHRITDEASAAAYLARLKGVPPLLLAVEQEVRRRADRGILPPRFSLEKAAEDARSVVTGAPFGGDGTNALLADFTGKLDRAGLSQARRDALTAEAIAALKDGVGPAYGRFADLLSGLASRATEEDGVWKLPDGAAFYAERVRFHTTLPMTPEEVHEYGLSEVKRLQGELAGIARAMGFQGDLPAFLKYLREDPRFFFPDDDAGREAYLAEARAAIEGMWAKLPLYFHTLPKAKVEVRRVEPFRERSSPPAFYNRPSRDGSRPGIYFINLATMRERPRHEIEAIAYHEAVPGHHMQNAIQQEAEGLPLFRRLGGYTVYGEGWGLYAEKLAKEAGMYADPVSDAGRINNELWRAIRLVVDTGIHAKRWSRAQAVDYMTGNSLIPRESVQREINRYTVNPGQALAYKIGMKTIEDLRARAAGALGDRFDLRDFHELVLVGGSMPLPVLDDVVGEWIESRRA